MAFPGDGEIQGAPGIRNSDRSPILAAGLIIRRFNLNRLHPRVRRELPGTANIFRVPDNARSTRETLGKLKTMIDWGAWYVIHFNYGIHDITREKDGVVDPEGEVQVPIDEYERNLRKLVVRLSETGAKLVWLSTTAIDPYPVRRIEDVLAYNASADRVMAAAGIPVNDLFSLSQRQLNTLKDNVHSPPSHICLMMKLRCRMHIVVWTPMMRSHSIPRCFRNEYTSSPLSEITSRSRQFRYPDSGWSSCVHFDFSSIRSILFSVKGQRRVFVFEVGGRSIGRRERICSRAVSSRNNPLYRMAHG